MKLTEIIRLNENAINSYLDQVKNNKYEPIDNEVFSEIENEGWLDELEDEYGKISEKDFVYTDLDLSHEDKIGLINFNSNVVDKFNEFDIKLKDHQDYPFKIVDFIDYDKGIVKIIKFNK